MTIATFDDVEAEFEALDDWDDRYRLLIDLGRSLPPMDPALQTEATKVRGCASQVWLYPTRTPDGRLHFSADSDAAIVKGLVALVLLLVQDQPRRRHRHRSDPHPARRARPVQTPVVEPYPGPRLDDWADRRNGGGVTPAGRPVEPMIQRFMGGVPHVAALGLRYVAHGADWAELALPPDPRLVGYPDNMVVANGAIFSLIDSAAGFAVSVRRGAIGHATLDLRVDYLATPPPAAPSPRG